MTDEDGMRVAELEGIVAEEDGYTAESDAAVLLDGLGIPESLHGRRMGELQGGQKVRVLLSQALFGNPAALLLDEPTNHLDLDSIHWLEEFLPLRGRAHRHLARPPLPEQRLHPHRRHRLPDDHPVHRRLRRHGHGQDPGALAHRVRQRPAREEDRPAERVHPALRGRHPQQPGEQPRRRKWSACSPATWPAVNIQRPFIKFDQARPGGRQPWSREGLRHGQGRDGGRHEVIKGFSAMVQRGEKIALMGRTASARPRCSTPCWPMRPR